MSNSLFVVIFSCSRSFVLWHYPFSASYSIKLSIHDNKKYTFGVCK